MRNTKKIVASLAAVGALAASGTAFTASNSIPDKVVGYDSASISGATASALQYRVSADGATITGADLTFEGNQSGRTVKAAFNGAALAACTVGTYVAGTDSTPVACEDPAHSVPTNTSTAFAVSVTD
jgi:hypothetical protein